jgi:hypothetical protein
VTTSPWPAELQTVFERSVTAEFATLTASGRPVTTPTTPYPGRRDTIEVSTGLTYPAKAERARRDPRVALLFADPVGPDMAGAPVVLVHGLASVRDSDLQANTDRYVTLSAAKLPDTVKGRPRAALRRMAWYYARIWVEITPLHAWWWPDRHLASPPQRWDAPEGTAGGLSDPSPPGKAPAPWLAPPRQWRPLARAALDRLPLCDLTVVGANGFPVCLPVAGSELVSDAITFTLGPGAPSIEPGPACLTLHGHPERFTGQENHTFVGTVTAGPGDMRLRVERALGDWSLAGGTLRMAVGFLSKGPKLRRRLVAEAARRDQAVPKVRFPSFAEAQGSTGSSSPDS